MLDTCKKKTTLPKQYNRSKNKTQRECWLVVLVLFNGILTFVGYLMPVPCVKKNSRDWKTSQNDIKRLCADRGCSPEDLSGAMDDRDGSGR